MQVTENEGTARVPLAVVSNGAAPYRIALHQRIVREMPEVELWSLFTHQVSNAAWAFDPPEEIRPMLFGEGELATEQSKPSRALHEWRKGGRIIRFLEEHKIEAVLLEGYNDPGRLRILRWCRRNGIATLVWGDSNILGDRQWGIAAAVKRLVLPRILRECGAVLACGSRGREYFAKYGVGNDRIFYYPVEPDYGLIERLPDSAIAAVQAKFSLATGRRRLVFSGRFARVKRPDLLIDAFAAIADTRPEWDLVMMGGGPLRKSLERRVPARLRQRIIWTGFLGEQETVSAIYRCCDVLVLPSNFEPWALAINEAAAAGLAIVASDVVGAAAELVRDGVNGFFFPAGDKMALTDRLLRTTAPETIDHLKAGSAGILADWRSRGDPIAGLRRALCSVQTLQGMQVAT
jgi:glycosyltransferase involved in cell wall biosynthesis